MTTDLFQNVNGVLVPNIYPNHPGHKTNGTSKLAADNAARDASAIRQRCLKILESGEFTSDEIAEQVGESILYIRPRLSELVAMGRVSKSGKRRENRSGQLANVWRKI